MTAADVMVGKPGGLTTSEALAKELLLVIVNPIPGQEERNSDHLLEQGAALRCNNLPCSATRSTVCSTIPRAWRRCGRRRGGWPVRMRRATWTGRPSSWCDQSTADRHVAVGVLPASVRFCLEDRPVVLLRRRIDGLPAVAIPRLQLDP